MKKPQTLLVLRLTGQVLTIGALLMGLAIAVPGQSQPTKLIRRTRSILSGRAIDPPPARVKIAKPTKVWPTTLPKTNGGASITRSSGGSLTVGGGSLSLRRPVSPARAYELPQRTALSQGNGSNSTAWRASKATEASHLAALKRQNPNKLSMEGKRIRGAAIRSSEERAGAAKARADRARAAEVRKPNRSSQSLSDIFGSRGLARIPPAQRVRRQTRRQSQQVYAENRLKNSGELKCEICGIEMTPARRSKRGVSPPPTSATIDHKRPRSKGGTNERANLRGACLGCNLGKRDND